jgi:low temperature requirement protein LtrA
VLTLIAPLRLRSTGDTHRKVTWLELFFDLIFVAAVAQVAEPLRDAYSAAGLLRFTPLFMLIWWAWTGHSVFSTRFDTDDGVQRALTLIQMFVVAVMAANAKDALDSRSSAGFAAAYAAVRLVLVAQYVRARHVPGARPLAVRYVGGHGVAALLWLVSALIPAPARFGLWAVAFAIDLGTPWTALAYSVRTPPDAAHLPERFGLFTLILLGEAVVAVMKGIESQEDWPPAAVTSAFLGMTVVFLIWSWYFDGVAAASEQPVRSRRDAWRFHIWSYAHFPLALGIVVTGVGVQRIVTDAARQALTFSEEVILTAAVALAMVAMTIIAAASTSADHRSPARIVTHLLIAAATLACGLAGIVATPVAAVVVVAIACAAQLAITVYLRSPTVLLSRHSATPRGRSWLTLSTRRG